MSGDYSRFTFDSFRDHDGVLLQQGRPLTDADWNEQVALANRRDRAGAFDTFGGRAVFPATTPDAFRLALSGSTLTIGRGRAYVDGILAENHGLAPLAWDAALAEQHGTAAVPYEEQPYLPEPPALPVAGGPYLVYLDVWQREVGHLVEPDLVEIALGVDTTTRTQVVWQVKLLGNDAGVDISCATPDDAIPGWSALTSPSAGRLTTALATFGDPGPCLVPPSGGYSGLENQLYRVEIHDGGAPGQATFKWSRDDASVETRVTRFLDATTIVVESVGKDTVLRFADGDWIEILDDRLELAGLPGQLRRIAIGGGVDDATRTIKLETAVTASNFPVDGQGNPDPKRHTRIRRWDQKGKVLRTDGAQPVVFTDLDAAGSGGTILVPLDGTIAIGLENGIVVRFDTDPAGGTLRSGDWWTFAARSADASVELLDREPPRGIHHHFARLGVYTPGSSPTDCRTSWPPVTTAGESCACSVCVPVEGHRAGTLTIQQAIDRVIAAGGGTVCLEVGAYPLPEPLRITTASGLNLRGQGTASRLESVADAIAVESSQDISLTDFAVRCSMEAPDVHFAAIRAANTSGLRIARVEIDADRSAIGIGVGFGGNVLEASVRECRIRAAVGIANIASPGAGATLSTVVLARVGVLDLAIEDNLLQNRRFGIVLGEPSIHQMSTTIRANRIRQTGVPRSPDAGAQPGVTGAGIALLGASAADAKIEIAGNHVLAQGSGIIAALSGLAVLDNHLLQIEGGDGDGVSLVAGLDRDGALEHCRVIGNHIRGFGGAGIAVHTRLGAAMFKQNQIARVARGIQFVEGSAGAEAVAIENNQIHDVDPPAGDTGAGGAGVSLTAAIVVRNARSVQVLGNRLARIGTLAERVLLRGGILVLGSDGLQVSANEIRDVGPTSGGGGLGVGIFVALATGNVDVTANLIRRSDAKDPTGGAVSPSWQPLVVLGAEPRAARGTPRHIDIESVHRLAAAFMPRLDSAAVLPATAAALGASRVLVRGNQLEGQGNRPVATVICPRECLFADNQCSQATPREQPADSGDVVVTAAQLVVANNRVDGGATAIRLSSPEERAHTVLGNLTRGQILVNGGPLSPVWAPLNVVGV